MQNYIYMCYTIAMSEIWKRVEGFANYEVSNMGNVRSLPRRVRWSHHGKSGLSIKSGKTLKQIPRVLSKHITYSQVTLYKGNKLVSIHVHRLVAKHFIPNPNKKPQVNHIDGDGLNNVVSNLEWVTQSENTLHAYRTLGRETWNKGKTGEGVSTAKPVLQLDKKGNLVKRWGCGLDAVRLGGFDSGCISRCVNGINNTHKGYRWAYEQT